MPFLETVRLVHPEKGPAIVNKGEEESWLEKGWDYALEADKPPSPLSRRDLPTFQPEWDEAFEEAGLDVKAIAASSVEDLDQLPVKGLGPAKAGKLIMEATEAITPAD